MKKIATLLISGALVLTASVFAQQEDAQATPNKKKQHKQAPASQAGRQSAAAQGQQPPARAQQGARKPRGRAGMSRDANPQSPAAEAPNGAANGRQNATAAQRSKGRNPNRESAPAAQGQTESRARTQPQAQTQAAPQAGAQAQVGNNRASGKGKKPADVQKIKSAHVSFHAQANPRVVPAVTFNESRRITGSEQWQGQQYVVFRSYRPARHDQAWYRSHYTRIELIGGGYYYFNGGYWYPAWGYQPSAEYYAYDGPIYAGRSAEPPDRVIADVQAALQEMGYYKGEVDGLLGPLTREALTGYQFDNGLYATAAIDEPTLDALGLG